MSWRVGVNAGVGKAGFVHGIERCRGRKVLSGKDKVCTFRAIGKGIAQGHPGTAQSLGPGHQQASDHPLPGAIACKIGRKSPKDALDRHAVHLVDFKGVPFDRPKPLACPDHPAGHHFYRGIGNDAAVTVAAPGQKGHGIQEKVIARKRPVGKVVEAICDFGLGHFGKGRVFPEGFLKRCQIAGKGHISPGRLYRCPGRSGCP